MYLVSCELTEEEMSCIMQAVNHYIYNNPNITDEQYEYVTSALDKITQDVI